jgi:RimJ/RimL family protein N-acetyltransferase
MTTQMLVHKKRQTAPTPEIAGAVAVGARIHLREVRLTDVNEHYYKWMNDPDVNRYLETRFIPQSLETIADFVRHMAGKSDEPFFAICTNDSGDHIGNIKIGPINWRHRYADVSLLIGAKDFWGKGYAPEAIALVTRFGFEVINLNKLEAGCYAENEGSARAFEKCGYTREGLARGHFFVDGHQTDCIRLGLLAADYFERRSR